MEESTWLYLPSHIVIDIFLCLHKHDRYQASLVCKYWNTCFHASHLWKTFQFNFKCEEDHYQLKFLNEYASVVRTLSVRVNQTKEQCREFACRVLKHFALLLPRKLENLSITFLGQNPLLYSGLEFHEAITDLFAYSAISTGSNENKISTLVDVNLSGLKINLDPSLLYLLALNHSKTLRKLNIQNGVLAANNHPDVIKHLVSKCHQLTHLYLYGSSINDEVVVELTNPKSRQKLKVLSIYFRRDQKYAKNISSAAWASLVTFCHDLKVTLGFDHTCPKKILAKVMKPEIPVSALLLETGTSLFEEIRLAASYYNRTLVKLTVFSPPEHNSSLDDALIFAVDCCKSLKSLHVFYILKKETIDYILGNNEEMRLHKTYTLKHIPDPSPWTPGYGYYT